MGPNVLQLTGQMCRSSARFDVENVGKWDLMCYSSKYIRAFINLVQKKQANGTQFLVVSTEELLFGVEKVGKWDQMFLQF